MYKHPFVKYVAQKSTKNTCDLLKNCAEIEALEQTFDCFNKSCKHLHGFHLLSYSVYTNVALKLNLVNTFSKKCLTKKEIYICQ